MTGRAELAWSEGDPLVFDVLTVQKALSSLMLDGLAAALQAVVGMILLAIYHPALFGFDLLL